MNIGMGGAVEVGGYDYCYSMFLSLSLRQFISVKEIILLLRNDSGNRFPFQPVSGWTYPITGMLEPILQDRDQILQHKGSIGGVSFA